MSKLLKFLDGYKTYIAAVGVGIVAFLQSAGFVDEKVATTLYGLLGAGGLAALRSAVAKTQ